MIDATRSERFKGGIHTAMAHLAAVLAAYNLLRVFEDDEGRVGHMVNVGIYSTIWVLEHHQARVHAINRSPG